MTQPDQPQPIDEPTPLPSDISRFLDALDEAADEPFNGLAQQPEAPANTVRSMPPDHDGLTTESDVVATCTECGRVITHPSSLMWICPTCDVHVCAQRCEWAHQDLHPIAPGAHPGLTTVAAQLANAHHANAMNAAADQPAASFAAGGFAVDLRPLPPGYLRGPDGILRTETHTVRAGQTVHCPCCTAHLADDPVDTRETIAGWLDRYREPVQLSAAQQIRLALAVAAITAMGLPGETSAPTIAPIAAWAETGDQA